MIEYALMAMATIAIWEAFRRKVILRVRETREIRLALENHRIMKVNRDLNDANTRLALLINKANDKLADMDGKLKELAVIKRNERKLASYSDPKKGQRRKGK